MPQVHSERQSALTYGQNVHIDFGQIKGYVEVNDDVENKTMKYLGEVWNERNRVNVIP